MQQRGSFSSVFIRFLILGFTSFGGPVAHIGFFRDAFVQKRQWLDDKRFSDLLSLCQFIPGPASSQLGMAIGYHRYGYRGALAAWLGFTLPSAVFLGIFAGILLTEPDWIGQDALHGLKLVALAVVLQAFLGMRASLAPDTLRLSVMLFSAVVFLFWKVAYAPIVVLLVVGLLFGVFDSQSETGESERVDDAKNTKHGRVFLSTSFLIAFLGLFALPFISFSAAPNLFLEQFGAYYRAGALVFGGGHVVLPLLDTEVVASGWVSKETFLAGYGAAQAVPGPLFTFASFLGVSHAEGWGGYVGGLLATFAIFLPSFLLLVAVLPHWDALRSYKPVSAALRGINAAVLGLLLATLYDPVFVNSVSDAKDIALAAVAFMALTTWRVPVLAVVLLGAVSGAFLY